MVRSPDGETGFFDIVAKFLQRDSLFILYQDYLIRTSIDLMKENGFKLKNAEADDIL